MWGRRGIRLEREGNGGQPSIAGTYVRTKEGDQHEDRGKRKRADPWASQGAGAGAVNVRGFQPGGAWIGVKSKREGERNGRETTVVTSSSKQQSLETRSCLGGHLAVLQVEEDAHVAIVGVDTLHPAVECLVEIIEVVLSEAAALVACAGSLFVSHAFGPAVVSAKGLG